MTVERLHVGGLRGLSTRQSIEFAIPTGTPGSGISILVGTNNAGKSTIVEAIQAVTNDNLMPFSEGKRNRRFGDRVEIRLELDAGRFRELKSVRAGGSQTESTVGSSPPDDIVVIPSRRNFETFFGDPGMRVSREQYGHGYQPPAQRVPTLPHFTYRLFELAKNPSERTKFDRLLARVLGYTPEWTIDQSDSGQSYLKFLWSAADGSAQTHSSDGLGEGLVSLFVILDALRDSEPGSTIVIDEPELSLHPQFQRRLRAVLSELSADRQIIYATHSPYFISWDDVHNGASVVRIHKSPDGTAAATPSRDTLGAFINLGVNNLYNPHVLGLDANEVFFLEGAIILTEGQEDVMTLPKVLSTVGFTSPASFFGWGVGGAENMTTVCPLLVELGYRSVVGILDNDKSALRDRLRAAYATFHFDCIPADDVRPKKARPQAPEKIGLVDDRGDLRAEHVEAMRTIVAQIETYLQGGGVVHEIV